MKKFKMFLALALAVVLCVSIFSGCEKEPEKIVIFSSANTTRLGIMAEMLEEKFPEYDFVVEYQSTSTGYGFLKSLVNAWGEEKAFEYFEKLSENISQFTSGGNGPVNAIVQEEAFALSDRIMVMEEARLVQLDTPENIIRMPANDYVKSFVIDNLQIKINSLIKYVNV